MEALEQIVKPLPISEIRPGMYMSIYGNIAKVQKAKYSERIYAKALNTNTFKFEYMQGLVFNLKERLDMAYALEFGRITGHCCVCGRLLTNYKSIDLGIGPICRGYL